MKVDNKLVLSSFSFLYLPEPHLFLRYLDNLTLSDRHWFRWNLYPFFIEEHPL
jgi:hypothetical protein